MDSLSPMQQAVLGIVVGALLVGASGLLGLRAQQPPVPAQRHEITIRDFRFEPTQLTAAPGDTIVWINRDVVPHTATENRESWDSGALQGTRWWYLVVQERGSQSYYCRFHPAMKGSFVVKKEV